MGDDQIRELIEDETAWPWCPACCSYHHPTKNVTCQWPAYERGLQRAIEIALEEFKLWRGAAGAATDTEMAMILGTVIGSGAASNIVAKLVMERKPG